MPKAAAIKPIDWAQIHDLNEPFAISDLNKVVMDYARIDLDSAARLARFPLLIRVVVRALYWIAVVGIIGPLVSAAIMVSGGGFRGFDKDFSPGVEIPFIYVGSIVGAFSMVYLFLGWVASRYRQWDRTLCAMAVFVGVGVLAVLVLVYGSSPVIYPRLPLTLPVWFALVCTLGTIVGLLFLHTDSKPPSVDAGSLSAAEIDVLMKRRHEALIRLRSRGIVDRDDFAALDAEPLSS